jgi:outer membrane protein OmpA-like peptidoglycan-associated protein
MRVVFLSMLLLAGAARADESVPSAPRGEKRVKLGADRIELSAPIFFDTGKATIKAISFPLLGELAETLTKNPAVALVEIGVHSDERGDDEYNLRISDERAGSVKAWLVAHGVAAERLRSRGYGETRPLCTEHNEACWSRNRRTELLIVRPQK